MRYLKASIIALLMGAVLIGGRGFLVPSYAEDGIIFRPGTLIMQTLTSSLGTSGVLAIANSPQRTPIVVRVVCTAACFMAISHGSTVQGISAMVVGNSKPVFIPANVPEYFRARAGDTVIHIDNGTHGQIFITEMDR